MSSFPRKHLDDHAEHFNPDLEAILQEIARDPRAKLLEVPSSGALIHSHNQPQVGIAAASLTRAEVEVLTVHREELAERLKERCLIELYSAPDSALQLHRSVEVGHALQVRDPQDWEREAKQLLDYDLGEEPSRVASDVIRRCIAGEPGRPVSVTQIATAMMRVATREQGRCYIALDLLGQEHVPEAIGIARQVLEESPSPLIASYTHELLATAHWKMGRQKDSIIASQNAISALNSRIHPVLCLLDSAVRAVAKSEAIEACHLLDDFSSPHDPAIIRFVRPERMARSLHTLSREARELATALLDTVGDSSRKVLDAILL